VNKSDLIIRDDDKEEAVLERLKVQKVPEDLLSAISEDGVLIEVDGEKSIEAIHKDLVSKIKNVKKRKH
jgi:adenylate kinase family enzyme